MKTTNPIQFLPEFADATQTCQLFGMGKTHLYKMLKSGDIRSVLLKKEGALAGKRLIDLNSVREYLKSELNSQTEYEGGKCNAHPNKITDNKPEIS